MDELLIKENRGLTSNKTPSPVREFFSVDRSTVEAVSTEESKGKKLYKAKVSDSRPNENRRLYPPALWERVIKEMAPKLGEGYLAGAIDHASYFAGGNLESTVLIWRELVREANGEVLGKFEIIEGHSKGRDFKAQVDASLAVGFSTYGFGTAHEPSEAERKAYGLPEGTPVVIMDSDRFELKSIDAVTDPSCTSARLAESFRLSQVQLAKTSEENKVSETSPMDIKTLEDLKTKAPDVFKLHENAIAAACTKAVEDATKPLKDANAKFVAAANAFIGGVKSEGIELPKHEVLPAETAARITSLEKAVNDEKTKVTAAEAKQSELQTKLDAAAAEKADIDRQAKAKAKLEALLKDEKNAKFSAPILKAAEKRLADKAFTAEAAEAFVKEKVEEYAALNLAPSPKTGLSGSDLSEQEQDALNSESQDSDAAPEVTEAAKKLEAHYGKRK